MHQFGTASFVHLLASPWHGRYPAVPLSLSHSLGGAFSRSTHLSPKPPTPSAGARCRSCRPRSIPPIAAVLHRHGNQPPSAVPSRLTCCLLHQSAPLIPSVDACFLTTETPCRLYLMPRLSYFSPISVQVWRG